MRSSIARTAIPRSSFGSMSELEVVLLGFTRRCCLRGMSWDATETAPCFLLARLSYCSLNGKPSGLDNVESHARKRVFSHIASLTADKPTYWKLADAPNAIMAAIVSIF
jgi:hypothetical protein